MATQDRQNGPTTTPQPPIQERFVLAAAWVIPMDPPGTVLTDHAVVVAEGRIAALLPITEAQTRYPQSEWPWIVRPNHVALPGFVNAHTHAAMTLLRGIADDLPLERWLNEAIWPREQALVSPEFVYEGSWIAAAEMIAGGITTALDMYFFPDAAAQAFHEAGLRAMLGLVTLEFPTPYANDADAYLEKGLAAWEKWRDTPLLSFALAPHAPYTVSDATFARIAALANELELPVHLHLNETANETPQSLAQFGVSPLERLARTGILETPQVIAAHGVHLDRDELVTLGKYGAALVHCPTSNMKLASGAADVTAWHAHGVIAALGSDGAASNNRLDLFWEMRHAALLAKLTQKNAAALPAATLLEMATLGGAKALGLADEIGSLTPGKSADLITVSFESFLTRPLFDPISHLVWVADREQVCDVWIAGVAKKRDHALLLQKSNTQLAVFAEKWRKYRKQSGPCLS
ncbi:MAG TPA: TRZ/ATZ family hydrolase [Hydrogenophilus thermoluteolus]|nr:TRZ/ATZ family hydrolase [Hydrogenophilus thermoluteolus]